jgi:hypothetical protein
VQNVTYQVLSNKANKGEKALILNNVTGFFKPGCMTAVVSDRRSALLTWTGNAAACCACFCGCCSNHAIEAHGHADVLIGRATQVAVKLPRTGLHNDCMFQSFVRTLRSC